MNLKDRLKNTNSANIVSDNENFLTDSFSDISYVFDIDESVKNIIIDLLNRDKNIILTGNKSIDKQLAANYILFISGKSNAVFINNAKDVLSSSDSGVYIMTKCSVKETVKIFEYIICGYKSFILALDLNNPEKIIEKLKTLIAVNFPNLTDKNTNILLSESNSVFVFISRNEDGLYYITAIKELVYNQGEFDFKVLFEKNEENIDYPNPEPDYEQKINTIPEVQALQVSDGTIDNQADANLNIENNDNKTEQTDFVPVKINKYKLLKEKIKNKKRV